MWLITSSSILHRCVRWHICFLFELCDRMFFCLIKHHNWYKAYMAISFEKEAYARGRDLTYLKERKHFAQWRNSYKK